MDSVSLEESRKLRGGYYTPDALCNFLANWAIKSSTDVVLEPSCGDGGFVDAAALTLTNLGCEPNDLNKQIFGVEFNEAEAKKASKRIKLAHGASNFRVSNTDFFQFAIKAKKEKKLFDVVLGNPPFIRYQSFKEEHRDIAFTLMNGLGMKPNKMTNAWVPFVVAAADLLKDGGRFAMVIPSELYQVTYSGETRKFLLDNFSKITLINFKELIFEDAQQEVIVFLGEKNVGVSEGINFLEFRNVEDFITSSLIIDENFGDFRPVLKTKEKWTKYYLASDEIDLLRHLDESKKTTKTLEYFDVDVGVVSGQNKFFIVDKETTEKYSLEDYSIKCVTRTNFLQGLDFKKTDWENTYKENKASKLLVIDNTHLSDGLSKKLKDYIKFGESEKLHTGYKCRIRKNWFCVPSIWVPEGLFLRQVYKYPKIVLNSANACPSDTIHRLSFKSKTIDPKLLVLAFLNSMTFAHAEVMGRSYGGGVLTFEPSESEDLLFPKIPENFNHGLDFKLIDKLLKEDRIEDVLDMTDEVFLRQMMGLSLKQTKKLRSMWKKLSNRRLNRKFVNVEETLTLQ